VRALLGEVFGKGLVADKAVLNELLDLRGAEHVRMFIVGGRHGNPHIAGFNSHRPLEAAIGRLVFRLRQPLAPLSAAQEDRRDIEDFHHHGARSFTRSARWGSNAPRIADLCRSNMGRRCLPISAC
jgi:hypothetical protein